MEQSENTGAKHAIRLRDLHPWTPPAPQGLSSRLTFGSRLLPSIRSQRPPVVGLDEIRGSAPDHSSGLLALGKSRAPPTPVRPFMPSSTLTLAARGSLSQNRSRSRGSGLHRHTISFAAAEQGPEDPCQLVGDRGHDDVERTPAQQAFDPGPELPFPPRADPDQSPGAVHELPPQVAVPSLAQSEQALLAATRALPRDQPQPRCKMPARAEALRIANRGHQGGGDHRSNPGYGRETFASGAIAGGFDQAGGGRVPPSSARDRASGRPGSPEARGRAVAGDGPQHRRPRPRARAG